eukprot:2656793-Rhodomonas_salina.1
MAIFGTVCLYATACHPPRPLPAALAPPALPSATHHTTPTLTTRSQCQGQTLHSLAGCGVPTKGADMSRCHNKTSAEAWRALDVL